MECPHSRVGFKFVINSAPANTHICTGTSQASAHASGVMAKYLSEMPAGTTPAQLKNTLINTWVETLEGCRKRSYCPIFSPSFLLSAVPLRTEL